MIIKSMSRKVPSFGQLIGYIDRDDDAQDYALRHNLMGRDQAHIQTEFEANGGLLQKRKNGVYLYHEIISITRADGLSEADQKARLYDIAQTYIDARCPENMVYGGLHSDKDHSYHMHLMISANRAGDAKRLRLTKAQFREIQIQTERHVLEKYPELEQKVAIEKQSDRGRGKQEAELERRTGKRPKREEVLERVTSAFDQSLDKQSLLDALGRENLELYVRGKNIGVIDHESGKRHRLKTLDLDMADRIALRMEGVDDVIEREAKDQEHNPEVDRAETAGSDRVEPEQDERELDDEVKAEAFDVAGQKEKGRGEEPREGREREKRPRRRRGDQRDANRDTVKKTAKGRDRDQEDGRKSRSGDAEIREADKDNYVKYGSNADPKSNPSPKQNERAEQEEIAKTVGDGQRENPDHLKADISEPDTGHGEGSRGPLGALGGRLRKVAQTVGRQAKHEIEEAGKLFRYGMTGQDEELGKTIQEKEAEAKKEYQKQTRQEREKAAREKEKRDLEKIRERAARRADERSQQRDQADQQQRWRDEIASHRNSGRDDDGRGRE